MQSVCVCVFISDCVYESVSYMYMSVPSVSV